MSGRTSSWASIKINNMMKIKIFIIIALFGYGCGSGGDSVKAANETETVDAPVVNEDSLRNGRTEENPHLEMECTPCNIEAVVNFEQKMDHLSQEDIRAFLCSFDKSCENNVEYSEYSNEMLFRFLQKDPELLLKALNDTSPDSKLSTILQIFSEPVSDEFETDDLVKALELVEVQSLDNLKLRLIDSLKGHH